MAFTKKGKQVPATSSHKFTSPAAASQKTGGNQWAKDAMAGTYKFDTGGVDKKGKRPGFSKKGSVDAKHVAKMKGKVPTHGIEEKGETKPDVEWGEKY